MHKLSVAIAAIAAIATPVVAQTAVGERMIASVKATGWVFFGDNQTRQRVADAAAQGGSAIRITIPNDGGAVNAATGQSPIKAKITTGDKVRITAWLKGVSTASGGPAKAIVKLKDAGKPYKTYAEQTFDLTNEWKPYSIEYVATQDFPAGSTNMIVQFALGRQVVDVGHATSAIVGGNEN